MRVSMLLSALAIVTVEAEKIRPDVPLLSANAFGSRMETHSAVVKHRVTHDAPAVVSRANYWDPSKIADDTTWANYVNKGHHLKCVMEAPDKGAGWLVKDTRTPPSAASKWTGDLNDALRTWFWHENSVNQDRDCDFEKRRLKGAFNGVGLNEKQTGTPANGDNVCYRIEHLDEAIANDKTNPKKASEQEYVVDKTKYTATGAIYWFAVNLKGGAIIGMNLENPLIGTKWNWERLGKPEELPGLRFCSDIFWAFWVRDNPSIKNFRLYGAHNVVNDEAVSVAARALTTNGHERLTPWPGVSFDITTPEGQAIVGSPIGSTVAHMLTGHKAELGTKWIKKVTVFTDDARPDGMIPKYMEMHMFFHIEDVPIEDITDPKTVQNNIKKENKRKTLEKHERKQQLQSQIIYEQYRETNYSRKHIFRLL